jgi:hypothetical protein
LTAVLDEAETREDRVEDAGAAHHVTRSNDFKEDNFDRRGCDGARKNFDGGAFPTLNSILRY